MWLRWLSLDARKPEYSELAAYLLHTASGLAANGGLQAQNDDGPFYRNDDTEYKERLFAALEETFNAGKMTIRDGPAKGVFRLVFDKEGFPDAETAIGRLPGTYNARVSAAPIT